jgi:hypothetical protein
VSRIKKPFEFIIVGLLLYLFLALIGCAPDETTPASPPAIRGSITQRSAGTGGELLGSILVEGQIEEGTSFDKASVAVTSGTRIFEQVGQNRQPTTFAALQVGRQVEAWFDGPVAESYPVQATASDIVILK